MEVGEENNEKRLVKIIYFSPKKINMYFYKITMPRCHRCFALFKEKRYCRLCIAFLILSGTLSTGQGG